MQDPLTHLRPLHLPPPVAWWPWAPGWYVVVCSIMMVVMVGLYYGLRYWRRHAAQRSAQRALRVMFEEYQDQRISANQAMATMSALLRRVALVYCADRHIAGLQGQAWLDFLAEYHTLSPAVAKALAYDVYQAEPAHDKVVALFTFSQAWLRAVVKALR